MHHLKSLTLSFVALSVISTLGLSQGLIPYKNGKLQGDISIYDSTNHTVTTGSFDNNIRTGEWVVKDTSENILYERTYTSLNNFKEIRSSDNEGVLLNYKHPIERSEDGLYFYPETDNSNVLWSKRVWSILPEKHHGQLYSQEVLIKISDWVNEGKIKVYKDDEMSKLIAREGFDVRDQKIEGVTIKKDYYFDKSSHLMQERIIAITFHIKSDGAGNNQVFSVYYPTDGRKLLSSFNVSSDSTKMKHYDDLFFFQNYVDIIYNEENAYERTVDLDFDNIDQYRQISNDIKSLILTEEHKYWLKY